MDLRLYLIIISKSFLLDGCAVACVDVLQITHAAISMVRFVLKTDITNFPLVERKVGVHN